MNVKLTLVFMVLAGLISFAVFKHDMIAERLSLGSGDPAAASKKELSKESIIEFFRSQKVYDYNSKTFQLDLKPTATQKAIYVHMWASWCGPCLVEIPELIDFANKNKDRAQFVLVSMDEAQEDLAKFLKNFPEMNEPNFIKVWDYEKKISKHLDVDRLPMTIILEPSENKVRTIRSVVDWKKL